MKKPALLLVLLMNACGAKDDDALQGNTAKYRMTSATVHQPGKDDLNVSVAGDCLMEVAKNGEQTTLTEHNSCTMSFGASTSVLSNYAKYLVKIHSESGIVTVLAILEQQGGSGEPSDSKVTVTVKPDHILVLDQSPTLSVSARYELMKQ